MVKQRRRLRNSKYISLNEKQLIKKTFAKPIIPKKKIQKKAKLTKELLINASLGLRPRKNINYHSIEQSIISDADSYKPKKKRKGKKTHNNNKEDFEKEDPNAYKYVSKLPNNMKQLKQIEQKTNLMIKIYEDKFFEEIAELKYIEQIEKNKSSIQENSIPISFDVRSFNFKKLRQMQQKFGGRMFDAIMMGFFLILSFTLRKIRHDNQQLHHLQEVLPLHILVYLINKYRHCQLNNYKIMDSYFYEYWGYQFIDEIVWVKKTVNGKIAKNHGYYLQHAKESCLIGVKGDVKNLCKKNLNNDVIFSERRGQSQKPEEIYQYIESFIPNGSFSLLKFIFQGYYLEIFGRRNNLRNKWVTIGNEI